MPVVFVGSLLAARLHGPAWAPVLACSSLSTFPTGEVVRLP